MSAYTSEDVAAAYEKLGRNVSATAREFGIARQTVNYHLKKIGANKKPVAAGQMHATQPHAYDVPEDGVRRYILTAAQNNTYINEPFWKNLVALSEHYEAEILVGTYNYNTNAFGQASQAKGDNPEADEIWFDPRLTEFIQKGDNVNIDLAPGLRWCGRANILPTAVRPLSGFETYCGTKSGIFPHAKIALESLPGHKADGARMNYTTGTVTQQNYIQRKAGLKAEHHHTYGALIVEVDADGDHFVRQLNADADGRIYDLELTVHKGKVKAYKGGVEAITWGDIHFAKMMTDALAINWQEDDGIIDVLRPKYQFMHDLLDFQARRHHSNKDPHERFRLYVEGEDSVESEIKGCAAFLDYASRPWSQIVVVDSNHDNDLERWLREADYRTDPHNAEFFLECQLAKYRAIRENNKHFHTFEWALERAGAPGVIVLDPDESFTVAGIECGMHGHLGPNGSRGTPRNLSKVARKANTGHTHSASIIDGLYTAGCSAALDQGYNKGPSSWSHSHVVTYPNGKRAIITILNGKWRG